MVPDPGAGEFHEFLTCLGARVGRAYHGEIATGTCPVQKSDPILSVERCDLLAREYRQGDTLHNHSEFVRSGCTAEQRKPGPTIGIAIPSRVQAPANDQYDSRHHPQHNPHTRCRRPKRRRVGHDNIPQVA